MLEFISVEKFFHSPNLSAFYQMEQLRQQKLNPVCPTTQSVTLREILSTHIYIIRTVPKPISPCKKHLLIALSRQMAGALPMTHLCVKTTYTRNGNNRQQKEQCTSQPFSFLPCLLLFLLWIGFWISYSDWFWNSRGILTGYTVLSFPLFTMSWETSQKTFKWLKC